MVGKKPEMISEQGTIRAESFRSHNTVVSPHSSELEDAFGNIMVQSNRRPTATEKDSAENLLKICLDEAMQQDEMRMLEIQTMRYNMQEMVPWTLMNQCSVVVSVHFDCNFAAICQNAEIMQIFTSDLQSDLCTALHLQQKSCQILCLNIGGVVADIALSTPLDIDDNKSIRTPLSLAEDLVRQVQDANSVLRRQRLGRLADSAAIQGLIAAPVCESILKSQRTMYKIMTDRSIVQRACPEIVHGGHTDKIGIIPQKFGHTIPEILDIETSTSSRYKDVDIEQECGNRMPDVSSHPLDLPDADNLFDIDNTRSEIQELICEVEKVERLLRSITQNMIDKHGHFRLGMDVISASHLESDGASLAFKEVTSIELQKLKCEIQSLKQEVARESAEVRRLTARANENNSVILTQRMLQQRLAELNSQMLQVEELKSYWHSMHERHPLAVALRLEMDLSNYERDWRNLSALNNGLEQDIAIALSIPPSCVQVLGHVHDNGCIEIALCKSEGDGVHSPAMLADLLIAQIEDETSLLRKQLFGKSIYFGEIQGPIAKEICEWISSTRWQIYAWLSNFEPEKDHKESKMPNSNVCQINTDEWMFRIEEKIQSIDEGRINHRKFGDISVFDVETFTILLIDDLNAQLDVIHGALQKCIANVILFGVNSIQISKESTIRHDKKSSAPKQNLQQTFSQMALEEDLRRARAELAEMRKVQKGGSGNGTLSDLQLCDFHHRVETSIMKLEQFCRDVCPKMSMLQTRTERQIPNLTSMLTEKFNLLDSVHTLGRLQGEIASCAKELQDLQKHIRTTSCSDDRNTHNTIGNLLNSPNCVQASSAHSTLTSDQGLLAELESSQSEVRRLNLRLTKSKEEMAEMISTRMKDSMGEMVTKSQIQFVQAQLESTANELESRLLPLVAENIDTKLRLAAGHIKLQNCIHEIQDIKTEWQKTVHEEPVSVMLFMQDHQKSYFHSFPEYVSFMRQLEHDLCAALRIEEIPVFVYRDMPRDTVCAEIILCAHEDASGNTNPVDARSPSVLAEDLLKQARNARSFLRKTTAGKLIHEAQVRSYVNGEMFKSLVLFQKDFWNIYAESNRRYAELVSVSELDCCKKDLIKAQLQISVLQGQLNETVPKSDLELVLKEKQSIMQELERIHQQLLSMVPKQSLLEAEATVRQLAEEVGSLEKRLSDIESLTNAKFQDQSAQLLQSFSELQQLENDVSTIAANSFSKLNSFAATLPLALAQLQTSVDITDSVANAMLSTSDGNARVPTFNGVVDISSLENLLEPKLSRMDEDSLHEELLRCRAEIDNMQARMSRVVPEKSVRMLEDRLELHVSTLENFCVETLETIYLLVTTAQTTGKELQQNGSAKTSLPISGSESAETSYILSAALFLECEFDSVMASSSALMSFNERLQKDISGSLNLEVEYIHILYHQRFHERGTMVSVGFSNAFSPKEESKLLSIDLAVRLANEISEEQSKFRTSTLGRYVVNLQVQGFLPVSFCEGLQDVQREICSLLDDCTPARHNVINTNGSRRSANKVKRKIVRLFTEEEMDVALDELCICSIELERLKSILAREDAMRGTDSRGSSPGVASFLEYKLVSNGEHVAWVTEEISCLMNEIKRVEHDIYIELGNIRSQARHPERSSEKNVALSQHSGRYLPVQAVEPSEEFTEHQATGKWVSSPSQLNMLCQHFEHSLQMLESVRLDQLIDHVVSRSQYEAVQNELRLKMEECQRVHENHQSYVRTIEDNPVAVGLHLNPQIHSKLVSSTSLYHFYNSLQRDICIALDVPLSAVNVLYHSFQSGLQVLSVDIALSKAFHSFRRDQSERSPYASSVLRSAVSLANELIRQVQDTDSLFRRSNCGKDVQDAFSYGPLAANLCLSLVAARKTFLTLSESTLSEEHNVNGGSVSFLHDLIETPRSHHGGLHWPDGHQDATVVSRQADYVELRDAVATRDFSLQSERTDLRSGTNSASCCSNVHDSALSRMLASLVSECARLTGRDCPDGQVGVLTDLLSSSYAATLRPCPPMIASRCRKVFTDRISVALVCPDGEGAEIFCTLDGTEPTLTNFAEAGPSPLRITLYQSAIIRAMCVGPCGGQSRVVTDEFVRHTDPERMSLESMRYSASRRRAQPRSAGRTAGVGIHVQRVPDVAYAVVTSVADGGAADIEGTVRPGDVLLSIDGQETRQLSVVEVTRRLGGAEGSAVRLTLMRRPTPVAHNDNPVVYELVLRRS